MNKNDLKNSIEAIEPDNAMKTRLKAKVTEQKKIKWYSWKTATGVVAAMVAFALIFTLNLPYITTERKNEIETVQGGVNIPQGFIMVASAAEAEEKEKYETLEVNETFPFAYSVSVTDARNMTEQEKSIAVKQSSDNLNKKIEEMMSGYDVKEIYMTWASATSFENIVLSTVSSNSIKFDLKDKEIESINIKSSSKWGTVEYYDDHNCGVNEEKGTVMVPPHGKDITVDIKDYHEDSGVFHWMISTEMEEALNADPDMPLSKFWDIVTITVNYKDGQKAIGVIDVAFDDDGVAKFTCKDYRYE